MSEKPSKVRLDEILIGMGLVTEEIVKKVLQNEEDKGLKLGSRLLYHGYVDERGLVRALAKQYDCQGVFLLNLEIHDLIVKMIPKKVALARTVMPFEYNPDDNVLMVACIDPTDQDLIAEINFVARGKEVKFYIAPEIILYTVIARYYLGHESSEKGQLLLELPEQVQAESAKGPSENLPNELKAQDHLPVLLVTNDAVSASPIKSILERDNYQAITARNAEDAVQLMSKHKFDAVFIHNAILDNNIDFIERVRKYSTGTTVRGFDSPASLFFTDDTASDRDDMMIKSFELFTSLLSSKTNLPYNHSGQVGEYAQKLCERLGIPREDRLLISAAAYLHDLAKFYYSTIKTEDSRETISLTAKLLASLNYSPVVIEMLQSMYSPLRDSCTSRLPLEILGGNILTIVDLFCESIPPNEKLSLDRFDVVSSKLRDMIGRLFLPEVAEAFINLVQDEMLETQSIKVVGQVMIYADDASAPKLLEMRLKNDGFRPVFQNNRSAFVDMYMRSAPDFMIIIALGTPDSTIKIVDEFAQQGINFEDTPAFLLVEPICVSRLTCLIDRGIEDIIPFESNLDLLISKIRRLQVKLQALNESRGALNAPSGAFGRLTDMSLVDLIQALGSNHKTVKITLRRDKQGEPPLTVYLDHGYIHHAHFKNMDGVEAVYAGFQWHDGAWAVEPISIEELPEANVDQPNEGILQEGLRRTGKKLSGHQPVR